MRRRPPLHRLIAAIAPVAVAAVMPALVPAAAAAAPEACRADPLGGRPLYLRGSFNGWTADDRHRFTWACDRHELVATLSGEHRFKLGDEAWSADADFGAAPAGAADAPLAPRGRELLRRFDGTYRFVLRWPAPGASDTPGVVSTATPGTGTSPRLVVNDCPAPPLPAVTQLYLRGTMNNWGVVEDQAFLYQCDGYYLNLRLQGRHEFRIGDATGTPALTFGDGAGPFVRQFDGAHTLRLAWADGRPQLTLGPKTFADPRVPAVTDPVALGLRFDSREAAHKQPFGAVTAGSSVRFVVDALPGVDALTLVLERRLLEGNQERLAYTELARVPMQREAAEGRCQAAAGAHQAAAGGCERFVAQHRFDAVAVHGYWFEARIGERRFVLQNNSQPVAWTREKGAGGPATVAEAPARTEAIRRFRLSVYRPDFRVPDWAADAIWYQVFPERFRNGNPANDPRPGQRKYQRHDIERHARWLEPPWRPGRNDGSDTVWNNDFFGGDLAGLTAKLDHLKALGVTAIYTTPIFLAASNHKYDHADYRRIDPGFGTEADFRRLTAEAARRGMRVVIDASFNHTGSDSRYFDRYGNYAGPDGRSAGAFAFGRPNPASPYASWYALDASAKDPDRAYRGWTGVADLPELDKAAPAWRDFAFGAPDSITRHWLRAGAGGWRMDVAPWVPDDFWRDWRTVVKATKPDAVTIAETWFDPAKHLLGDMFDSTMNYVFRNAVLDWAGGGPATALATQLEHLREQVPPPAHAALMNLLSSHDVPRALHVLGHQGPATPPAKVAEAQARLRLAVALQMAYPGAPAVYYGDEVGVTGGEDPDNRAPYPWADEGGRPDTVLQAVFQRLIALRQGTPVLRRGALLAPLCADDQVLVLARALPNAPAGQARWAVLAFNNHATAPRTVTVALPAGFGQAPYRDALATAEPPLNRPADGRLTLTLPPLGAQWWIAR